MRHQWYYITTALHHDGLYNIQEWRYESAVEGMYILYTIITSWTTARPAGLQKPEHTISICKWSSSSAPLHWLLMMTVSHPLRKKTRVSLLPMVWKSGCWSKKTPSSSNTHFLAFHMQLLATWGKALINGCLLKIPPLSAAAAAAPFLRTLR